MSKRKIEQLAKKMYISAVPSKYSYFKQTFFDGKKVKWAGLEFEQEMWMEMAQLALTSIDKIKGKK